MEKRTNEKMQKPETRRYEEGTKKWKPRNGETDTRRNGATKKRKHANTQKPRNGNPNTKTRRPSHDNAETKTNKKKVRE